MLSACPLHLHLLLLLLLLLLPLEAGQARSVGVVDDQSVGGWLLLPRTRAHLAWLRHSSPGQFWAVLSLDGRTEKPHLTQTVTLTSPLSVLHKTWFSKYSKDHNSLPAFSSVNNGHQGTPVYYGDLRHRDNSPSVGPTVSVRVTAKPSYHTRVRVRNNSPGLLHLLFKIIPRKLYIWFKDYIKILIYILVFLDCNAGREG